MKISLFSHSWKTFVLSTQFYIDSYFLWGPCCLCFPVSWFPPLLLRSLLLVLPLEVVCIFFQAPLKVLFKLLFKVFFKLLFCNVTIKYLPIDFCFYLFLLRTCWTLGISWLVCHNSGKFQVINSSSNASTYCSLFLYSYYRIDWTCWAFSLSPPCLLAFLCVLLHSE